MSEVNILNKHTKTLTQRTPVPYQTAKDIHENLHRTGNYSYDPSINRAYDVNVSEEREEFYDDNENSGESIFVLANTRNTKKNADAELSKETEYGYNLIIKNGDLPLFGKWKEVYGALYKISLDTSYTIKNEQAAWDVLKAGNLNYEGRLIYQDTMMEVPFDLDEKIKFRSRPDQVRTIRSDSNAI
jgi:hypothetical protein